MRRDEDDDSCEGEDVGEGRGYNEDVFSWSLQGH